MRKAKVFVNGAEAGILCEVIRGGEYLFEYHEGYDGPAVSRTMPRDANSYRFKELPPFFEGLLPEGSQLESLLKLRKIDRNDLFSQLIAVGGDMVGAVTVEEVPV